MQDTKYNYLFGANCKGQIFVTMDYYFLFLSFQNLGVDENTSGVES